MGFLLVYKERLRARHCVSAFSKTVTSHEDLVSFSDRNDQEAAIACATHWRHYGYGASRQPVLPTRRHSRFWCRQRRPRRVAQPVHQYSTDFLTVARQRDQGVGPKRCGGGTAISLLRRHGRPASGQTFAPFTLPPKKCDAAHWITIRTSAASDLPPEGTRLTPCYAGQASLPDRPPYACPTPKNALARVELKAGAGAITVAEGANHYRIIGLELTRTAGTGTVYALIRFEDGIDHVIIDRSWIHGTPLDESVRGVNLGAATMLESLIRTSTIFTASRRQARARTPRPSLVGIVMFLRGYTRL